ncbi:MAG: hypothetical protein PHN45_02675 [Methylococcales bacterium]|nr:hypothetical protein [Methylococcales bacterium]MDD5753635.1 hypothetical protein [Methylococcales bacterium]
MLKNIAIATTITLLSGCATLFEGSTQNLTVSTMNDKTPEKTQCNITNEEGEWQTTGGNTSTVVKRDGNMMTVNCENDSQRGITYLEPSFSSYYFVIDALSCGVGLFVDASTNALYSYPTTAIVGMQNKLSMPIEPPKPVIFGTPQPQPTH